MREKAVHLELTTEQRERLKQQCGKKVRGVKLNLEQLEARIAPKLSAN
jgi:hypothetical protein